MAICSFAPGTLIYFINGNPLYIIPRQRLETKAGVATKVLIDYNVEIIEQEKN